MQVLLYRSLRTSHLKHFFNMSSWRFIAFLPEVSLWYVEQVSVSRGFWRQRGKVGYEKVNSSAVRSTWSCDASLQDE